MYRDTVYLPHYVAVHIIHSDDILGEKKKTKTFLKVDKNNLGKSRKSALVKFDVKFI